MQPRYPRVTEQVARKVEELRVEQPHQKVLPWDELRRVVKEEVNRLLSEKQLSYVCKCLANAGVVCIHFYLFNIRVQYYTWYSTTYHVDKPATLTDLLFFFARDSRLYLLVTPAHI